MNNAEQQARCQLASIIDLISALRNASNDDERECALTHIHEDPLAVEVRGDWRAVGQEGDEAAEFSILLCTGGPAARIRGDLDRGEPDSARIEFQDWGTVWEPLRGITADEQEATLDYCRQFVFAD
jgi:hypothetical protein